MFRYDRGWVKAEFSYVIRNDVICVTDEHDSFNNSMSVTNDAEAVVKYLVHSVDDLPILYMDTEGIIDELTHNDGEFTGFKHLGAKDWDSALIFYKMQNG